MPLKGDRKQIGRLTTGWDKQKGGNSLVIGDSARLKTNFGMCFGALVASVEATTRSHRRHVRGICPKFVVCLSTVNLTLITDVY